MTRFIYTSSASLQNLPQKFRHTAAQIFWVAQPVVAKTTVLIVYWYELSTHELKSSPFWDVTQSSTFRDNLQSPLDWFLPWPLKIGRIGCHKTSVTKYQSNLRNIPKEQISHRSKSLNSRTSESQCIWVTVEKKHAVTQSKALVGNFPETRQNRRAAHVKTNNFWIRNQNIYRSIAITGEHTSMCEDKTLDQRWAKCGPRMWYMT